MSADTDPGAGIVRLAERELRAAWSILLDPLADGASAAPHLLSCWRLLAHHEGDERAANGDPAALGAFVRGRGDVAAAERDGAADVVVALAGGQAEQPWARPAPPSSRRLVTHARLLGRVLGVADRNAHGPSSVFRRRLGAALKVALVVVALVVFAIEIRGRQDLGRGKWRAEYYKTMDFSGTPFMRRDQDINFSWRTDPPLETISSDKFSIRWDTCLIADDDMKLVLELKSNDGSRLFVDGKKVLDTWKTGRRVTGDVELEEGVHHIKVEYQEKRGSASIHLTGSVDGSKPGPLPESILSYPGATPDPKDVCASVRR